MPARFTMALIRLSPSCVRCVTASGDEPIGSPPEAVTQRTQEGLKRMSAVVKRAGISAD